MSFSLFAFAGSAIAVATLAGVLFLSRWRWWAVSAALVGAIGLLALHGLGYVRLYFDDSYITVRHAQPLADGLGPNWNSDGRGEGYTNFLWMALLAGVGKLGFDLVAASQVLAFLALAATFLFVYWIWQLWG